MSIETKHHQRIVLEEYATFPRTEEEKRAYIDENTIMKKNPNHKIVIASTHHAPIVYRVYDELKLHVGMKNRIGAKELAKKFGISQRALRDIIHEIRESHELEKAIGSYGGYFVCTEEDCEKAINRLYRQAFSTLKVARALEKKVAMNGQGKLKLGEYYADFVKSLGETDNG